MSKDFNSPPPSLSDQLISPPGPLVWEIQGYHWIEAAKYLDIHPELQSISASHNRDKWSFILVRGPNNGEYEQQTYYDGKLMLSRKHYM